MLNTIFRNLFFLAFFTLFACTTVAKDSPETLRLSAERIVSQATDTVMAFERQSVQWDDKIAGHFRNAKAVIIVPKLRKGGLFIGGEVGDGVMLVRQNGGRGGNWSHPLFYNIASLSFGIQFGYEQSQHLLFIMSEKALRKLQANEFELGGDVTVAAGNFGGHAEVATTFAGIDIVSYSLASGAYAGFSFEGSRISYHKKFNDHYYGGTNVTAEAIMAGQYDTPQADTLRQLLGRHSR